MQPDMLDCGQGPTVVLIPGLQGRCEWLRPLASELARSYRVVAFSLNAIEGDAFFPAAAARVLRAIRRTGRPQAHLAGISFGGLIASYCAAQHPEAVRSLTLISSPSPDMAIDERSARFLRAPLATLPLFLTAAARRSSAEIRAARPTVGGRVAFAAAHAARAIRFPQSPRTMAHWVAAWKQEPPLFDLSRIQAPTLVVTGEQELDRVVPVDSSLEYLARIPHARHATLPKTGHLGFLLEPARLADLVTAFLGTVDRGAATAAPDERLPRP